MLHHDVTPIISPLKESKAERHEAEEVLDPTGHPVPVRIHVGHIPLFHCSSSCPTVRVRSIKYHASGIKGHQIERQ